MKNLEKDPKESNHDYAYRVIRDNIVTLDIKPGSMISEQDLATELHLSRTPVHEAIHEISKTKIIEIFPQKGILVSLIDMDLVDESVFVRSTIESAVTEEACLKATEKDIEQLEENIGLQSFYLSKNNLEKVTALDNAFHKMMYKITNKMQAYYMVKTINIHYDRFRELRIHTSDPAKVVEEHIKIFEAIQNHNSTQAKELILSHLNRTYKDEADIRNKYPDYFSNKN